jgi:hypothetical protein
MADFVAEVGDDDGGAAARTRLLMRWSAICCTGIIASDAVGLRGTYAKALLCGRRRSHHQPGEPPEVLSDSSERELELGAPWPP